MERQIYTERVKRGRGREVETERGKEGEGGREGERKM